MGNFLPLDNTAFGLPGGVPQRYVFVTMGALAIFNMYAMRTALSVAITEMAAAPASHGTSVDSCPPLNDTAWGHDDATHPAKVSATSVVANLNDENFPPRT